MRLQAIRRAAQKRAKATAARFQALIHKRAAAEALEAKTAPTHLAQITQAQLHCLIRQRNFRAIPKDQMKTLREKLTPELVKALEDRTLTNSKAAGKLGVNASYLSTVFNSISKKKRGDIAVQREAQHKLVDSRRQLRIREAKKVTNGKKSIESAARTAGCSERTMRRYIEKIAPTMPEEAYE